MKVIFTSETKEDFRKHNDYVRNFFKPQSIIKDTSHITSILSSVGQGSCDAVAICPNWGLLKWRPNICSSNPVTLHTIFFVPDHYHNTSYHSYYKLS
jgi:hypothetical protein